MRTVSIRLCDMERTCIPIGFVGENLYTRVRIDSKVVFDEYPTAIASLTVQDPNGSMYPGFISRDGDVIIWDVTASDLVYGGNGALQLAFFVDDVIAKSYICRTYVSKAMIGPGTIPTPIASWIDAANVVLGEAEEVVEALDNMTVAAETLAAGSTATVEISDVDGHKHIDFGIPQGPQGEQGEKGDTGAAGRDGTDGADGFSPTLVVSTITGGHRITITDKNGSQTVDVLDGEKGETGATGNGIASVVLNQDYTLTINYTNGQSMTTTSIRGEKGETGATGQTGATGATPIISIGTVTTGAPGSEASATMDTTDPAHPVLSMSIPEGEPGDATIDDTSTAADRVWSAQKVNELKSAINSIDDSLSRFAVGETLENSTWEQGRIDDDGTKGSTNKICRTTLRTFSNDGFAVHITLTSGYEIQANEYSSNSIGSFIGRVNKEYVQNSFVLHFVSGHYYIITIKKTDGTNLAPADVTTSVIQFYLLDKVSLINDTINNTLIWKLVSYEQGMIGSDGKGENSNSYVRSDYIPIINFKKMYKPTGMQAYICCYTADKTFIDRDGYGTSYQSTVSYAYVMQLHPTTKYIRISAGIPEETVTPSDIIVSDFYAQLIFNAEVNDEAVKKIGRTVEDIKDVTSANALAPSSASDGLVLDKVIGADGSLTTNTWYATTGFIEVNPGDVVVATFNKNDEITFGRLVTYDDKKAVKSGSTTSVTSFTVPDGVKYIRFSANKTYMTNPTARINLDGVRHYCEPYYQKPVNKTAQWNATRNSNMLLYPLSTLPEYFVKNLAYKPLGVLSKGYICIVSDDGDAEVASYTIPMFVSKGVPCTLAMMKSSDVLQTQEGLETVLSAIEDNGFCVAQHGGSYWTNSDEYGLTLFFDSEKTYWDSVGITPYGACSPGHQCNDMIRALSGARFGCHRAGYYDGKPWYGGSYYINGPRSNMYSLTSQNIIEGDINYWKDKCDETLSNKWLMMIHLHENELTSTTKAQLEAVIDYAKQIGLTFITMKDIPTMI